MARPLAMCHQKSLGGIGVSSGRSAISISAAANQTCSSVRMKRPERRAGRDVGDGGVISIECLRRYRWRFLVRPSAQVWVLGVGIVALQSPIPNTQYLK